MIVRLVGTVRPSSNRGKPPRTPGMGGKANGDNGLGNLQRSYRCDEVACQNDHKPDNVFLFDIFKGRVLQVSSTMARPKRKTEATTLKMTPEVRNLWERCAAAEVRSLTNMFEVMVRTYAAKAGVKPVVPEPDKQPQKE